MFIFTSLIASVDATCRYTWIAKNALSCIVQCRGGFSDCLHRKGKGTGLFSGADRLWKNRKMRNTGHRACRLRGQCVSPSFRLVPSHSIQSHPYPIQSNPNFCITSDVTHTEHISPFDCEDKNFLFFTPKFTFQFNKPPLYPITFLFPILLAASFYPKQ